MRVLAVAAALGLGVSAATAGGLATVPVPIRGAPLSGKTSLQLLVGDAPPFVLDVDSGRTSAIRSTPDMRHGIVGVQDLGSGRALIRTGGGLDWRIYLLSRAKARPLFLGVTRAVVPSDDGQSLWITSAVTSSDCVLRQVGLDGQRIGEERPLSCSAQIGPGGVPPRPGFLAAAGDKVVLAGPERSFTMLDTATGAERSYPWPSRLYGRDETKVDKQRRYVALGFADPAWGGGPDQATDVWTLDTQTGTLAQVPGMPALVDLKFTSMEWTRDGRLVWLAQRHSKTFVVIWRPGEPRLQLKRVRIPQRSSGTDAFAILP